MTSSSVRLPLRVLLLVAAAAVLAGCETTGSGAPTQTATVPEPPMTHTRAAEQCWMSTEKDAAGMSLDKRADLVDKCIEQKIKGGSAAAEPASEAKKKKPAAAEAKKKKPVTADGDKDKKKDKKDDKAKKDDKDQKPADAGAPDKKP